jgi:signal peptidase I
MLIASLNHSRALLQDIIRYKFVIDLFFNPNTLIPAKHATQRGTDMDIQKKSGLGIIIKIISAVAGVFVGFLVCRIIIVPFSVPDNTMKPSLKKGDTVIFLKHVTPKRGDIVLIESPVEPGRVLIKRVVAAEGATMEIRDKAFFINNDRFEIPWKTTSSDTRSFPMNFTFRDNMPAVKISRNEYFVLSDNLDTGFDSRSLGVIREDQVIGRMIYRF